MIKYLELALSQEVYEYFEELDEMNCSTWGNVLNQYLRNTSIGTTVSIYVLVYLKLWFEKNEKPNFENSVKISYIYENRIFFHNNFLGAGFGAALHEIFGAEKLRDSPWLIFPFCDEIF
jgi:hypothetical protein